MQSYTAIPDTQTIASSLELLLNNDQTTQSNSSGTAFPTTNLIVGMFCYRYDLLKLYQLTTITPFTTWQLVCDLNKTPIFAQDVAAQYMSFAGGTFTGNLSLKASQPSITFWDTSEPNGEGIFQWRSIGDAMSLFRNTAASGDFSTSTMPVTFYHTDVAAFAQRPTFNGNTPWDSGNFTPSNYALLAGATFTGNMSSKGGSGAGVSATNVSAWASGSGAFLQLTDSTRTANNRIADFMFGGGALYGRFVTDDYSTAANWLMVTGGQAGGVSGISLAKRPTWQGYTPWDSNNFNPANYALTASPTITGNVTFTDGNLTMEMSSANIELGSNSTPNTPFIDFHSSGSARDYDARIMASSGSTTADGQGVLTFYAGGGCLFDGLVNLSGPGPYSPDLMFSAGNSAKYIRLNGSNGALEFLNSAQTSVIASLTDGGSLSCGGNLTCQNGSLWSYGYGGNNAAGVFYLGSSGNTYIYNTGSQVNLFSNTGNFQITAQGIPLYLTNLEASSYWEAGPNSSNSFVILNSNGTGVYVPWGGTSWVANSDERIKNILAPIDNAVDAAESIRTVRYTLKSDESESPKVYIGVIAQDVQSEFPELVNERDGILGVEYDGLSVIALAAIKGLSGRVKQLEALLAAHGMMQ